MFAFQYFSVDGTIYTRVQINSNRNARDFGNLLREGLLSEVHAPESARFMF